MCIVDVHIKQGSGLATQLFAMLLCFNFKDDTNTALDF